jgi:kinesin family member 11
LKSVFDSTQRHLTGQMAEMVQFRQEISANERANVSSIGEISSALENTVLQEREKAEQERKKLASEVVSLISAVLEGQHSRWSNAVEHARQDLSASQNRVQNGFQLVSNGLDGWAEREGTFSKRLLGNKDEVKKSIVEASKVSCNLSIC